MSKEQFRTPKFRVSFPQLLAPGKPMQEGGKEKYSVMMIFDEAAQATDHFKAIKKSVVELLKNEWPKAKKEVLQERYLKVFKPAEKCVRQDDGERYPGCEDGCIVLKAQSDYKPEVINQQKESITEESEVYAGCYAICKVTPSIYDMPTNKGVTLYLGNVMKLAEGERLAGNKSADADFEDVEVEEINLDDINL